MLSQVLSPSYLRLTLTLTLAQTLALALALTLTLTLTLALALDPTLTPAPTLDPNPHQKDDDDLTDVTLPLHYRYRRTTTTSPTTSSVHWPRCPPYLSTRAVTSRCSGANGCISGHVRLQFPLPTAAASITYPPSPTVAASITYPPPLGDAQAAATGVPRAHRTARRGLDVGPGHRPRRAEATRVGRDRNGATAAAGPPRQRRSLLKVPSW